MNCNSIYTCKSCLCLAGFNCFGSSFSLYCINVSNFNLCDVAFCYLFYRFNNLCLCTCRNYNRMNYNRILRFFCGILRNCAGNYYLKVMVLNNLGHVGVVIFFSIVLFGKVFYIIINNRCGCGLYLCGRSLFFHNRFCFFFREFLEIYGYRLSICRSNCFGIVYRLFLVSNDRLCLCYRSFFHYRSCYGSCFFYSFCYGSFFLYRSCYGSSFFYSFRYGSLNRLCTCYRCNESINFVNLSTCNNMCSRCILHNALGKRTSRSYFFRFYYGFFLSFYRSRSCFFGSLCYRSGFFSSFCYGSGFFYSFCYRSFIYGSSSHWSSFFYSFCYGSFICYCCSNECFKLTNVIINLSAGDDLSGVHILEDDRSTRTEKLVNFKNDCVLKRIVCTNELYDLLNNCILFVTKINITTVNKLGDSAASFIIGCLGEAFDHLDNFSILISTRIKERCKVFSIKNNCYSAVIYNGFFYLFFYYGLGYNSHRLGSGFNKTIAITSLKLCDCLIEFSRFCHCGLCLLLKAFFNEIIEWANKRSLCRLCTFGCESCVLFSFLCLGLCHSFCNRLFYIGFCNRSFYRGNCCNKFINIVSLSAFDNTCRISILYDTVVKRTNNRFFSNFGSVFCYGSCFFCSFCYGSFFCSDFCFGFSDYCHNVNRLSTFNNVCRLTKLYNTLGNRTNNRFFSNFGSSFCYGSCFFCSFCYGSFFCSDFCFGFSDYCHNVNRLSTFNNVCRLTDLYNALGKRTNNRFFSNFGSVFCYGSCFFCSFCYGSFFLYRSSYCYKSRIFFLIIKKTSAGISTNDSTVATLCALLRIALSNCNCNVVLSAFFCASSFFYLFGSIFCYGSSFLCSNFFCRISLFSINIGRNNSSCHKSVTLGLGLFLCAGDNFCGIYILKDVGEVRTKNKIFSFL